MKTKEQILESHYGSDYWVLTVSGELKHILKAMDEYAAQFKPIEQQADIGGPALDKSDGGEQLGNEGSAKSVWVGICKEDYIHWSESVLKCRCCGHKKRA